MKMKQIFRMLALALMWLIATMVFDIVLNIKIFQSEDWLAYLEYTFTSILPFVMVYCLVISANDVFLLRKMLRDYPFAKVVFIKAILQFAVMYFIHFVGTYIIFELMPPSSNEAVNAHYAYLGSSLNIFYIIYFFVFSFHFSLYAQVSRKFGSTNLYDIIMGTYFKPKEAQRIFMFLDLNQSTTIAEEIGHLKYSRLIQECFSKLTHHIENYDAEVYQYVGDEAVLTWQKSNSIAAQQCLYLFKDFQDNLDATAHEFKTEFGWVPKFKSGVCYGTVAIAEVGDYKRDIAFHGTVLNTGARLCQLCKEINEDILFSNSFFSLLTHGVDRLDYIGDYMLTGRTSNEKVYRLLS